MTVGLDYLKPYADTAASGSARRIEERRHSGWLLELERALLANTVTKSASGHPHDSVERHRDTGDSNGEKRALSTFASREITGTPLAHAGAPQGMHEAAKEQGDTRRTQAVIQSASNSSGHADAQRPGTRYFGPAAASPDFNPAGMSYRLPAQLQAVNPHNEVLGTVRVQDVWSSRMSLQRGVSEVPYFATERSAGPEAQAEADGVAVPQDAEPFHDSETYPRRKLHLFHSEDGVHAWIRDIDVSESGVHAIASALNTELAASGLKLAALTLNGKRLAYLLQDERLDEEVRAGGEDVSKMSNAKNLPSQATQHITVKGAY